MDLLLRVPNNLYLSGLMQTRYAPVKSAKLCKFRPTKDVSPGIVNEGESCPIFLWAIHPSVCRHFSANLSSELLELSSDRAITAHTIITHRLFFFFFFLQGGGKGWGCGSHKKMNLQWAFTDSCLSNRGVGNRFFTFILLTSDFGVWHVVLLRNEPALKHL